MHSFSLFDTQRPGGQRLDILSNLHLELVGKDDILETNPWPCGLNLLFESEAEPDVLWCCRVPAQDIEIQLLAVVASREANEKALQSLLAIEGQQFGLFVTRNIKVSQL